MEKDTDIVDIAMENKRIIAKNKRLCEEIKQGLNNHDVVVDCFRKIGIQVRSRPKTLVDVIKYFLAGGG